MKTEYTVICTRSIEGGENWRQEFPMKSEVDDFLRDICGVNPELTPGTSDWTIAVNLGGEVIETHYTNREMDF